jgi:hypothetical protein
MLLGIDVCFVQHSHLLFHEVTEKMLLGVDVHFIQHSHLLPGSNYLHPLPGSTLTHLICQNACIFVFI